MKYKQSVAQANANVQAAFKRILPNVLLKERINYQTIDNYLELHYTDEKGETDSSVENILAAIANLYRDNQLRWEEGKRPKTQKDYDAEARALNSNGKEADPLGLGSSFAAIKAVADAQQAKAAERSLDATQSYVRSVSGQTHSHTASARFVADREFKAQLAKFPKPTLAQAQEIDKAVRRAVIELFS